MKFVVVLSALLVGILAETYPDKYDNININDILNNKKMMKAYTSCLLDIKPCQLSEMKFLRSHIKEAIETDCGKCTPKQKENTEKIISHIIKTDKHTWEALQKKYDPGNVYTKKYEDRLAKLA